MTDTRITIHTARVQLIDPDDLARLREREAAERAKLTPEQLATADAADAEAERIFLFGRNPTT